MTTDEGAPLPEGEEAPPPGTRAMAIVRWGLVALMATLAVLAALSYVGACAPHEAGPGSAIYYCPMHPSIVQDQPGECPICSMSLVLRPSAGSTSAGQPSGAYACPMHPEVTSNDPSATCPKCGMQLVQKPPTGAASGVQGLAPVELSAERVQLMGMRVEAARQERLVPELRTVGFVSPREDGLAQIQTRFAGWVEELNVSETGQEVKRGQVLATLYSPELLSAQQEFLNARRFSSTEHALTESLAADARQRLELFGISDRDIDELVRTGTPKRALPLRSPVQGFVIKKSVVRGAYVQPGTELMQVADLSRVWVLASVYEHEIERVAVGSSARFEPTGSTRGAIQGRVQFISPTVDASTRTLRVRLELENPDLRLKPGMYGDVVLELGAAEGVVIPREAVVDTGVQQYVFVAQAGGRFEPRQVTLGARTDDKVEVVTGVHAGELVVTTGNFLLDSESHLRAAIEGMPASTGATDASTGPSCEADFDKQRFPDKYQACRACEVVHRGMGSMEADCKSAIARPWK